MCTGLEVCRRCELWDELAAEAPLDELAPCALCEEPWPPASLHPRSRICPACAEEIVAAVEADRPEPECSVQELARRVEERRRQEFERARERLRRWRELGYLEESVA